MGDFIFSLTKEDEYYFRYINTDIVNITYNYKKRNMFCKAFGKINFILVKLFPNFKFTKSFNDLACRLRYNAKLYSAIKRNTGLFFLDSYAEIDLLKLVKDNNSTNSYIAVWNSLSDKTFMIYKKYLDLNHIYSYSLADCKKYGIHHFNDFCLTSLQASAEKIDYDFYFLGRGKGREKFLSQFANLVKDEYKCKFDVFVDKMSKFEEGNLTYVNYINRFISYDDYLSNVFRTRCLVDFTTTNNITFRTIEAIMFKKKYISNNQELKKYDFYSPNNILILNDDTDMADINLFMKTKMDVVADDILKKYDFYTAYDFFRNIVEINRNCNP